MKNLLTVGLIVFGAYFLLKDKKTDENPLVKNDNAENDKSVFPLKKGDQNIFVKNLQNALINLGGNAATTILQSGGANGKFSDQMAQALLKIGFPEKIDETLYRKIVEGTTEIRNLAYVDNQNGVDAFISVGESFVPGYGYGRDAIVTIPNKTYLGIATGNYKNGMLEITTTINTKRINFWVATDKIKMVSNDEYNSLKQTKILEKNDSVKNSLLKV